MRFFLSSILKTLICTLFISVLIRCNKNKGAYIKGQVLEFNTGKPIPDINLSLIHGFKDKNGAHQTEVIASTASDQDGFYKISYHRELFNYYELEWRCENKEYLPGFDSYLLQHKKLAHTITLIPVGYIKIRLKKNSNSDSYVVVFPSTPDIYSFPVIKKSVPFDTTFSIVVRSYSQVNTYIAWHYFPNLYSDYVTNFDNFTINRGDTIVRTIEFN